MLELHVYDPTSEEKYYIIMGGDKVWIHNEEGEGIGDINLFAILDKYFKENF